MNSQNFSNHRRLHPVYHYFMTLLLLAAWIGVIVLAVKEGFSLITALLLLIFVYLTVSFILMRSYPLKAQDRAIRAEENLRHYVLTGRLLDAGLSNAQIAALRFAGDAEFPELSKRAAAKRLKPDEIKKAIQNWKADHDRV